MSVKTNSMRNNLESSGMAVSRLLAFATPTVYTRSCCYQAISLIEGL